MAPILFGLDLADLAWWKFGNKWMFKNTDYHLRRTKFIVYQLAMIFCVVSESLGTAALSDYVDQQDVVQAQTPYGSEYNNDYVGVASFNMFSGIYVAFIFGGGFFFDLMFPGRRENYGVRVAWRVCSLMATIFSIADVIALTIYVISRRAYITGVPDPRQAEKLIHFKSGVPLVYRHNGRAVASLVFLWLGWPFVLASTVVMWVSLSHDEKQGPYSSHRRLALKEDEEAASGVHQMTASQTRSQLGEGRTGDVERVEQSDTTLPITESSGEEVVGKKVPSEGTPVGHSRPGSHEV